MKNPLKALFWKITVSPLAPVLRIIHGALAHMEIFILDTLWNLRYGKPSAEEVEQVRTKVTFMYKSFERQKLAVRLFNSIQKYYPGVRVVIADDSAKPLEIDSEFVTIIHLPFNSGVSRGLNCALEQVRTPFLVKVEDDMILCARTDVARQLSWLESHPEVDLTASAHLDVLWKASAKRAMKTYYDQPMTFAPKPQIIPHMTRLDAGHIVVAKPANVFLARTESIRKIGWDDNIRMIDHAEFFYRAAGILVSTISTDTVIFHNHNPYNRHYNKYRGDWQGDAQYIRMKRQSYPIRRI